MKTQIIINDTGSYSDYGVSIKSRNIGIPKKKKIKQTVPYMNGTYDFSYLYNEQAYEDRELTYVFNIIGANKMDMHSKKINFLDWIMNFSRTKLVDTTIPGFHFLAEAEETSFEEKTRYGELTVKFTAYPFKISNLQDGHDIWDDFNFELDMVQETKFTINGTQNIKLYNNSSIGINPTIICSSNMQIKKGSATYNFSQGTSKSIFKLDKGLNELTIIGNGTIEFQWYKELL